MLSESERLEIKSNFLKKGKKCQWDKYYNKKIKEQKDNDKTPIINSNVLNK